MTAALLAPFEGWNKDLLDAALQHNATSCALSNFPDEHRPDVDMLRAITLDLAAVWREFALELNTRLLGAAGVAEVVVQVMTYILDSARLGQIEEAGTAVAILAEGLERDELLRSRLTRAEVLRPLKTLADSVVQVTPGQGPQCQSWTGQAGTPPVRNFHDFVAFSQFGAPKTSLDSFALVI